MTGLLAYSVIGFSVVVAFYMAWNVGANDVANAMGTSVGSGALTLRRAVIVAGIFEFAGAFFLGGSVSDTIRKGIVDPQLFASNPNLLVYGMLAALLSAAVWLNIATLAGLPVSTTHSIVGAVAGFGIIHAGGEAIDWAVMGKIAASWIISPIGGGALGFAVFVVIRRLVFDKERPDLAVRRWVPLFLFVVFSTLMFSLFKKGAKNFFKGSDMAAPSTWTAAWISLVVGLALAGVGTILIRRYVRAREGEEAYKYVERIFIPLQIITASYVALAHGSNDVANAVGPLAAILNIIKTGTVEMSVGMPAWVLALGGVGIVLGLATFGYRVMATIGTKIVEMSPSRGFSAEFAAATVVMVCSLQGMPISTTHTLVGAVVGVGLARGMQALNYKVLYGIAASWLITVPVSAVLSMIFFSILKLILP